MIDLRPVIYVIGLLLCILAGAMLVAAVFDAAKGDPHWHSFVKSALLTAVIGLLCATAGRARGHFALSLHQAFILTSLGWLVLSAASALPFLGFGLDYADAFFEAVSGFTTTGSTVMTNLDSQPHSILLWRALLHWVGGVGIIVMAIIMLPMLKVGGMQLFQTESSDRSEKIVPKAAHLIQLIMAAYAILTVACGVAYHLAGMSLFDSLCNAMSTLSTGGFSNHDRSFGYYESGALEWIGVVFMLAGGVPFVALIAAMRGSPSKLWHDPQVVALVRLLAAVSLALAAFLSLRDGIPFWDALRESTFNVVSIVTTTGFASTDYQNWGTFAVGLMFFLTFVGACTGSTAGGLKTYRLIVLWTVVRSHLVSMTSPRRVVKREYDGRHISDDILASVLAFIAVYVACAGLVALALNLLGLDLVTSLSGAATALANVGPGLGDIIGPAGNFSSLSDSAKVLLAFTMLLGRLELFTLLVLFVPAVWRA